MAKERPDNIVYSETDGYHANKLPYSTTVGAPAIKIDDVVTWKNRGISSVNKEFEDRFNDLKIQYERLIEEYQWNELIYNAKFSFEPVVGEVYHLYRNENGMYFLSLISKEEWTKEYIGTFKLNSDKKWILLSN